MIIKSKFLNILIILSLFCLVDSKANSDQAKNFKDDLNNASTYWTHNNLGDAYFNKGDYDSAINEYKTAIEIIENMPGDEWPNLKKEDVDRMNKDSRNFDQIYSRYGLIAALDKAGRYDEALENVDWLMKNQVMKGKEEFLKRKLESMKQNLLQKKK